MTAAVYRGNSSRDAAAAGPISQQTVRNAPSPSDGHQLYLLRVGYTLVIQACRVVCGYSSWLCLSDCLFMGLY